MKTFNVFNSNVQGVDMKVFGAGADGKRDPKMLLDSAYFEITPEMLEDLETNKEGEYMSLAAYGLCRLMQDRCSAYTDGSYEKAGYTGAEAAEDRISEYQKVYDLVRNGRFNAERETAGKKNSLADSLIRAFVNFCKEQKKPIDALQAVAILGKLDKEKLDSIKLKLTNEGYIKAALEELKEERAQAVDLVDSFDLEDLF